MKTNKSLQKGGQCKCTEKIFSGGNGVTPDMSGYKQNEGIGEMNDPRTILESSRLISGGKKTKRRRKSMRKHRKTKSRKMCK